jgi:DNA-binding transcriptional LysR family regulator
VVVIGANAQPGGQDPRVELGWLETFLAVADRGGFTAASETVHRSQSRVSAHIAALERDLGVRLVDRTHRPARLTAAGKVFARHAREVVTGIGAARSAVVALRGMDAEPITVLTTPCVGATLFPAVLAELVEVHPGLRVTLSERAGADVERRLLGNGPAIAVLPRLAAPLPPGLRERVMWREPLQVVVPVGHELDLAGKPVTLDALAAGPLIVCGTQTEAGPANSAAEVLALLADRGLAVEPRAAVDTPQTLLALVRAGIGIGVANAVALRSLEMRSFEMGSFEMGSADLTGLVVLDIDDPSLVREVAAYWYDVLTVGGVGMELHRAVVTASPPPGGSPPGG